MPFECLSSTQNPIIKTYNKLTRSRRYRQEIKKIALEGPNLVKEALMAEFKIEVLFCTRRYYDRNGRDWLDKIPDTISKYIVPPNLFKSISTTDNPQEVAAIIAFDHQYKEQESDTLKLALILDRIRDPGNMGTIIRTAAAVGAEAVFVTKESVDPFSQKVLRSTAGTIFRTSIQQVTDPVSLVCRLKSQGVQIVAGSTGAELDYWAADLKRPSVFMVGNESDGLDQKLLEIADITVKIPLAEGVESLNAAIASGLLLYEAIRQRKI